MNVERIRLICKAKQKQTKSRNSKFDAIPRHRKSKYDLCVKRSYKTTVIRERYLNCHWL